MEIQVYLLQNQIIQKTIIIYKIEMKKSNIIKNTDINKENPNTGVTSLSTVLSSLGVSLSTLVF